jgi:ESCO1/2 acetyl-transferase/zinc-finger of acetyl-transferase ESCO
MYLDLGQRNFAQNQECTICGMLYVHGMEEDAKQHAAICQDYLRGVSFPSTIKAARVVGHHQYHHHAPVALKSTSKMGRRDTKASIVEVSCSMRSGVLGFLPFRSLRNFHFICFCVSLQVRPSDSACLWKKVAQIQKVVNQELGFVESASPPRTERNHTAYLCICNNRAVGLVMVERITHAYRLLQLPTTAAAKNGHGDALERSTTARGAVLGVHQVWVHGSHRKRGIARCLVNVARSRMVYGTQVSFDQVAFSSPTQAGVQFAYRYVQMEGGSDGGYGDPLPAVLVYDCL